MILDALEVIVKENKKTRFNSKVLLINNYENIFELKNLYSSSGYDIKDLREFQTNENQWFGVSKLNRIINKLEENTILFSISEIVRFYNQDDFKNFFDNLFSIENKNINVIIPLFGLKSRFNNQYFNTYYRKNEYDFVYEIDSNNDKIDLNIVEFEVPFSNTLDNIKDWLNFYSSPTNNIICSPRPLVERINNQHNDDLIHINNISNQKEFIEKYMHKNFPLNFKENEIEYWNKLIIDLKENDLEQILKSELNLHILTPSEILKKICSEQDLYFKWLLKGYAILEDSSNNYFYEVIKSSDINDVLIEKIWFDIFDEYNPTYISQRYDILVNFYSKSKPLKNIEVKLAQLLKNYEQIIPVLTGITQVEKEYIVNFYALNKVNDDYIKKYYSDLNSYIDNVDFVNNIEWVENYFIEYKNSKINNQLSTKLDDILKEKNKNKDSFFNWYADTTFKEVSDFNIDKEKTFWIDGLGIEWLGVIKNYAMSKGFTCEFYLSKSKLPTTTHCNRFEDIKKTDALDRDYIHKQSSYQYPKNLIEEIDIIKDILDNHIHDDLTIVSDHGFSAFCSFQTKINSFDNDEHEGRCAKVDDILDDTNYFSYDFPECGRYLVSLNHTSLNNKTRREAHGGVTPEEVVVPIIKIYKSNNKRTIAEPIKQNAPIKKGFEEEDLF